MTRAHSINRYGTAVATIALCAGLLASCSSSGGGTKTSSSPATSATGNTVDVKNFSFNPSSLSVSKGTKVTWKFDDSAAHNVTASDSSFKSTDLSSGGSYSFTFNTAGTYSYICTIHQYMKGTITVK